MTNQQTGHEQPKPNWAAPFFTIWTGQALSLVGSQVGGFALVWWLTQASGRSATVLTSATLVAMLPGVFLGPVVGALVDRWSRRRVMIVADTIIALFSAWLALLFWTEQIEIWHVYVIMFVRALGGAFHWPAMRASTSLMVPREQLSRVAGMNRTLQGILEVVTPPLGAFLMEILPLHVIMAIDVATAWPNTSKSAGRFVTKSVLVGISQPKGVVGLLIFSPYATTRAFSHVSVFERVFQCSDTLTSSHFNACNE